MEKDHQMERDHPMQIDPMEKGHHMQTDHMQTDHHMEIDPIQIGRTAAMEISIIRIECSQVINLLTEGQENNSHFQNQSNLHIDKVKVLNSMVIKGNFKIVANKIQIDHHLIIHMTQENLMNSTQLNNHTICVVMIMLLITQMGTVSHHQRKPYQMILRSIIPMQEYHMKIVICIIQGLTI